MRVYNDKVLIHIDKKAQMAKRSKTEGGVLIHPDYAYMIHNLQYGEVIQVGNNVRNIIPEIEPGDIAIFHHTVEAKPNSLVKILPNMDELRVAYTSEFDMQNQVFATLKPDGRLIPAKHYVFLHNMGVMLKRKVISSIITLDNEFDFEGYYTRMIEQNKKSIDQLYKSLETTKDGTINPNEVMSKIQSLYEENRKCTVKLQGPKMAQFPVLAASTEARKELNITEGSKIVTRHELLSPLFIMDMKMMLCYKKYISLVITA